MQGRSLLRHLDRSLPPSLVPAVVPVILTCLPCVCCPNPFLLPGLAVAELATALAAEVLFLPAPAFMALDRTCHDAAARAVLVVDACFIEMLLVADGHGIHRLKISIDQSGKLLEERTRVGKG